MASKAKTPEDHKKPQAQLAAEADKRFEEVEGSACLLPPSRMRVADQLRLMGRLQAVMPAGSGEVDDINMDAMAEVTEYLEDHCVIDKDLWDELAVGEGAIGRVMALLMAYAGELGKDMN